MKKIIRIFLTVTVALAVTFALAISAFADEAALYTGTLGFNSSKENTNSAKISYGLDVVACDNEITFAGISGYPLNLSADKIACAMNLSKIDTVEITSLPDSGEGTIYLGSLAVTSGQIISEGGISLLSFESAKGIAKDKPAKFKMKVNGGAYEINCAIYMLDKINSSPTLAGVPAISLTLETYRGVCAGGVLCGYDPEGDELTYEIVTYPKNGYITLKNKHSGEYIYTPSGEYSGKDEFVYVVKDKYGNYSEASKVNVTVSTPYSNIVYNDLLGDGDYSYAINMTDKNVMNGEKVGDYYYFRPNAEVSRVDFIVSAMKVLGIENIPSVDTTVFEDDADIGGEVKGYISLAYSNKYISGTEEGGKLYFKPNESITMSEAAVIISNIIGYSSNSTAPTFANSDEIPVWSKDAVMSLRSLGIIEAPANAEFENISVDRSCMAKLLSRAVWVTENM